MWREALTALEAGRPRLVIFAPGGAEARPEEGAHPDTVVHAMTCHSGGTVEIYVEPQLPAPTLVLFGDSPVTRALADMAAAVGLGVRTAGRDDGITGGKGAGVPPLYAVVATMGEWDEEAVERALRADATYVGLVASPRRAGEVRRRLAERGVEEAALDRLVSPAGLDIGAVEPGEIAVTILAEIIQRRRTSSRDTGIGAEETQGGAGREPEASPRPATAVDSVCGMEVPMEGASFTFPHAGTVYYFCCARCRDRFAADPDRYVAA